MHKNFYLFKNIDNRDYTIVLANSVKEAENKITKRYDLEELNTTVSDIFILENEVEIIQ